MALSCAISGEVPLEPVVSPVSGAVFEKRLIEKHLSTSPTDPVNGEPLTAEQLVVLKASKVVRPRPANATSVPVLLKLLQDEWDAGMLENFKMKQHVETVRQELSHALYQHDAACRVIARLTKERDQARQALAMLQATAPPTSEPQAMEADSTPADDVIGKLQAKADELSKTRKKRAKAAELATAEDIKAMGEKSSTSSIHSAGSPGISALDLHVHNNNIVATGGVDKIVHVYDHTAESIVSTFKGHSKKVTSVVLHPTADVGLSSSLDQTVAVWNTKSGEGLSSITTHTKGVHSISLHPTGDYVLSASADKTWAFSDIHTGKTLSSTTGPAGLTSIEWHPDGIIFGSGTADNVVRIWDIKGPTFNIHNFEGHAGPVTAVAFSENGYYMASAAEDSTVKLWDLRKLVNFKTLDLAQGTVATSLHFDYSGVYLAVGGSDVSVYQTKTWDLIKSFGTFSGAVTGVKFGKHARMLATASLDRSLKIFA